MAFENYLVKVGTYSIPLKYVKEKSYKAKVNTLDLDSHNDANGILHRTVIQKIPVVTIQTLELTESEWNAIWRGMSQNFSIADERRASVSVWVPEWGRYVTQDMYLSDMEITIQEIVNGTIKYNSIQLSWKGYGE